MQLWYNDSNLVQRLNWSVRYDTKIEVFDRKTAKFHCMIQQLNYAMWHIIIYLS